VVTALTRVATGFGLLEGGRWHPEHGLLFSDMTAGGVHALAPGAAAPVTLIPHRKGIGGLVPHAAGGLVVSGRNVTHKRFDGSGAILHEATTGEQFFNDLTADRPGRLYVGSVPVGHDPGRLYRIDLDGRVDVLADDVLISNGLGADPTDAWLYHVDSPRRSVRRYQLPGGEHDTFVDTTEYAGVPDGLAVAADGSVWVAMAGGGVVVGWDERGRRVAEIAVPAELVTSVCFGDADLCTLYVLTGTNAEHPDPDGGSVFRTEAPCPGLPAPVARIRLARTGNSGYTQHSC
jgi:sugar lactone lactonase YvrE